MSPSSPSQWRASASPRISADSTSPDASRLPPISSAASASSVAERREVPRIIVRSRKLVIPAISGVSKREPACTWSDAVTTGAAGFSRTMTVIPLGRRWRVMPGD